MKGGAVAQLSVLEIKGYQGQPIANTFWRQDYTADHLAVLFPGLGYTADMPLLYYPARLLVNRGAEVLSVQYGYNHNPGWKDASDSDQTRWLVEDSKACLEAALAQHPYKRLTLIGKSLGTMAIARLLEEVTLPEQIGCVWLTPVLRDDTLRRRLLKGPHRGVLGIGSADPYFDPAFIQQLQLASHLRVMVVEHADHSLEIPGHLLTSLTIMSSLVREISQFIG